MVQKKNIDTYVTQMSFGDFYRFFHLEDAKMV